MILDENFLTEDGKGMLIQLVMKDDRFRKMYLRLPQEQAREGFRREVVRAKLVALGRGFEGIFRGMAVRDLGISTHRRLCIIRNAFEHSECITWLLVATNIGRVAIRIMNHTPAYDSVLQRASA